MKNYLFTSCKTAIQALLLLVFVFVGSNSLLGQTIEIHYDDGGGLSDVTSTTITDLCNKSCETLSLTPMYDPDGTGATAAGLLSNENWRWTDNNGNYLTNILPNAMGVINIPITALTQSGTYYLELMLGANPVPSVDRVEVVLDVKESLDFECPSVINVSVTPGATAADACSAVLSETIEITTFNCGDYSYDVEYFFNDTGNATNVTDGPTNLGSGNDITLDESFMYDADPTDADAALDEIRYGVHDALITIYALDDAGARSTDSKYSCNPQIHVIDGVTNIACNDELNITLDRQCEAEISADLVLEGTYCFSSFEVEIDLNGDGTIQTDETGVDVTITAPGSYVVSISNPQTGISCWGRITAEDKNVPVISCPDAVTVDCSFEDEIGPSSVIKSNLVVNDGNGADLSPVYPSASSVAKSVAGGTAADPSCANITIDFGGLDAEKKAGTISDFEFRFKATVDSIENLSIYLISPDPDGTLIAEEPDTILIADFGMPTSPFLSRCDESNIDVYFKDSAIRTYDEFFAYLQNCRSSGTAYLGEFQPATSFSSLSGEELAYDNPDDDTELDILGEWKILVCNKGVMPITELLVDLQVVTCSGTIGVPENVSTGCGSSIETAFSDEVMPDLGCGSEFLRVIERTWTVTNTNSNFSESCMQRVNIRRTNLSDIEFPKNLDGVTFAALNCQQLFDSQGLNPNYVSSDTIPLPALTGEPSAKFGELCENFQIDYVDTRIRTCGEFGMKIIRRWTVLDWCDSAIEERNQIIKINQRSPIIATCPPIQTLVGSGSQCTADYSLVAPLVVPNVMSCTSDFSYTVGYLYDDDGDAMTVPPSNDDSFERNVNVHDDNGDGTPDRISNLPLGRTWVRFFFEDECGNTGSCTTEVDVIDETRPNPVCIENTVIAIGDDGCSYLPALSIDNGSFDNCGEIVSYEISKSENAGYTDVLEYCCGCSNLNETVYLRVTDQTGLTNTCVVQVEVQNNFPDPILTGAPASQSRSCTAGAFDLFAISEAGKSVFNIEASCPNSSIPPFNPDTQVTATVTIDGVTSVIQPGDSFEPGDCGTGSIVIKYTIEDDCSSVMDVVDQQLTFATDFAGFNVTRWPQDYTIPNCINGTEPENLPANAGAGYIQTTASGCGSDTAISYDDQVFPDVVDACYKILRTWTVIDWCIVNAPGNTVDDGKRTYTQLIKVNDSSAPVITNLSNVNGNDPSCMHTLTEDDVDYEITDNCTPAEDIVISYLVDGNPVSNIFGRTYNNGTTITIEASDHCDNLNTFSFRILTNDTEAPEGYCITSVTTVTNDSGIAEIWVSDFSTGSSDNCDNDVDDYFINELGQETQVLTYDCDDIPNGIAELIPVTVYFEDDAGNINTCDVSVTVQDNVDACDDQPGSKIAGTVHTEEDKMVQDVAVDLMRDNSMMFNSLTQVTGEYAFNSLDSLKDYMVVPHKNDNYLNGVSTIDLVMIQRHILGLERFTSPYKVIAADTDNSGTINGVDLVELRKLILGITVELPHGQQSWRMPVKDQSFANPMSPFPYKETIELNELTGDMVGQDFIAVKIGDVNASSLVSFEDGELSTRSSKSLDLEIENKSLQSGSVVTVPVYARNMNDIVGLQSTLSFNPTVLQFNGVTTGGIDLTEGNLGLSNVNAGYITMSWNNVNGVSLDADEVLFELEFQVLDEGDLSEQLFLSSTLTNSEAYTDDMETVQLNLNYRGVANADFVLYQNIPNPFADNTEIRFSLPAMSDVTLTVYDVNGSEILRRTSRYEGGSNTIILNSNELTSAGVMYYKLETAHGTASRKMIQIR